MPERRVVKLSRPSYGRPSSKSSGRSAWSRVVKFAISKKGRKVGVLLVVVIGLQYLFAVRNIEVRGAGDEQVAKVKVMVQQHVSRRPWTSNLLTLSSQRLANSLVQGEPRLKTATVKKSWPSKLEVTVTNKQPALIWQSGQQRFVLDSDGTLIGYDDQRALPLVIDTTGLPAKVGDRVVTAQFVLFCASVIERLPEVGIKAVSVSVPDTTSEVVVATDKGYVLKLDTTRDADRQLKDLSSVLATLAKLKKVPAEYVDLRIEGKAYYR